MGAGVVALLLLSACGGVARRIAPPPAATPTAEAPAAVPDDRARALYLRARVAADRGDDATAAAALAEARRIDPRLPVRPSPPAPPAAPLPLGAGSPPTLLPEALWDPSLVGAYVKAVGQAGTYRSAIRELTALLPLESPEVARALLVLGRTADDPWSVVVATEALERGGTCDGGLALVRGEAQAALHRYSLAAAAVAVEGCDPPLPTPAFTRARLWDPADPAGALAALGPASDAASDEEVALRVKLLVEAGRADDARAAVDAALTKRPDAYLLVAAAVTVAVAQHDEARALALCDRMTGLTREGIARQRARVRQRLSGVEAARKELAATKRSEPATRLLEAELLLDDHRPDEAIAELRLLTAAAPLEPGALRLRGDAAAAAGDLVEARRWWLEAARAGDGDPEAAVKWFDANPVATAQGDAVALLAAVAERHPGNAVLLDRLAYAELSAGHPAAALTTWGEAHDRGVQPDRTMVMAARRVVGW